MDAKDALNSTKRIVNGVGILIWFLQALRLPNYRAITYPGLVVSFVAEVGLALWPLVKGSHISGQARTVSATQG